jgi:hypothetical protein
MGAGVCNRRVRGWGLERRLFERKNRNAQTKDGNRRTPYPLPVPEIEAAESGEKSSERRLYIEAGANENDGTVRVVFGRRNVDSPIPGENSQYKCAEESQVVPPNNGLQPPGPAIGAAFWRSAASAG